MDQELFSGSRYALPANFHLWLSGHKFKSVVSQQNAVLETFMADNPSTFNYSSEEANRETQEYLATILLLKNRLEELNSGKSSSILPSQIEEIVGSVEEVKKLRTRIAEMGFNSTETGSGDNGLSGVAKEMYSALVVLCEDCRVISDPEGCKKVLEEIQLTDDSASSLKKNLALLNTILIQHRANLDDFAGRMGELVKVGQLTIVCLLVACESDEELRQKAADALKGTSKCSLQDTVDRLNLLEIVKLDFLQRGTLPDAVVNVRESLDRQNRIFHSLDEFLNEIGVEVPEQGNASTEARIEGALNVLYQYVRALSAGQQQTLSNDLSRTFAGGLIDSSFQGNVDMIKQLTQQNNDLLTILLEIPVGSPRTRSSSVNIRRIIENRKTLHRDTSHIDQELSKLQDEIAAGIEENCFLGVQSRSREETIITRTRSCSRHTGKHPPEDLVLENNQLKTQLIEAEALLVLLKQQTGAAGELPEVRRFREKIRQQELQLRDFWLQNQTMGHIVEKLKGNNKKLAVQINANQMLKRKLRTLNFKYSQREEIIRELHSELSKQEQKNKSALRESMYEKSGFIKAISVLTEHLQKPGSTGKDINGVVRETIKEEVGKLSGRVNSLKEQLKGKQGENEKTLQELQQIAVDYTEIRLKNSELEEIVDKMLTEITDLETNNTQLTKNSLDAEIKFKQEINENKDQMNRDATRIQELETELQATKDALCKTTQDYKLGCFENEMNGQELESKRKHIEKLEGELQDFTKESLTLQENLGILREIIGKLDTPEELPTMHPSLQKEFTFIPALISTYIQLLTESQQTKTRLTQKSWETEDSLSQHKTTQENLKSEIASLQDQLANSTAEGSRLATELLSSQEQFDDLTTLAAQKDQETSSLTQQLEELNQQNLSKSGENENLLASNSDLQSQLESLQLQLASAQELSPSTDQLKPAKKQKKKRNDGDALLTESEAPSEVPSKRTSKKDPKSESPKKAKKGAGEAPAEATSKKKEKTSKEEQPKKPAAKKTK